jgi:hypothetical protein
MTGRWPWGDWTYPGRVRSIIGEVVRLAERAEKDQTLDFLHLRVRSPFPEARGGEIGRTGPASGEA